MLPCDRTVRLPGLFALLAGLSLLSYAGSAGASQGARSAGAADQQASAADDAIRRIREEALQRSQIMPSLTYLTEVIGPLQPGDKIVARANDELREGTALLNPTK